MPLDDDGPFDGVPVAPDVSPVVPVVVPPPSGVVVAVLAGGAPRAGMKSLSPGRFAPIGPRIFGRSGLVAAGVLGVTGGEPSVTASLFVDPAGGDPVFSDGVCVGEVPAGGSPAFGVEPANV